MIIKFVVYLLLVFATVAGCQRGNVVKNSINSIPMESVDVETGGKKGGGTHFSITSEELFLDYQYFDDEGAAAARLEKDMTSAKQVIESGNVSGNGEGIVGRFTVSEDHSRYDNDRYCLRWTRANRYTQVCSASQKAIEEFRALYDL